MLTREAVESRLEELRAGLNQAQLDREEASRRMLTYDGAIQQAEWTLAQMNQDQPEGHTPSAIANEATDGL